MTIDNGSHDTNPRFRWLSLVASDLAAGTTAVAGLTGRLNDGFDVPPLTNLVRESSDAIRHANVSAEGPLGIIVPGP